MSSSGHERYDGAGAAGSLRIVQIVETLNVGGLETMAVNLAAAHRSAGHGSAIYTIFEAGALAEQARAAGVTVVSLGKKRGFSPTTVARLASLLRRDGADLVHTHNSGIHHYGAVAGKLAGAAVVNTRHGLALHSLPRQETWFHASLPLTDAVVFVCEYGRRHYAALGSAPAAKSSVIRNGIPTGRFQNFRAAPGGAAPALRFVTVGRLVRAKAHGDLLDAFALVAREFPAATLDIWGFGELEQDLTGRIAALPDSARVRYRGAAAKPEAVFQAADVFVLSSISEGLPLVVLEAMAAGLPIVSTRVGGVPEVLAEGASWVAEPGKPASLAAAMCAAARADLTHAGEIAYRKAAADFSVEAMQSRYEALYYKLLRTREKTEKSLGRG